MSSLITINLSQINLKFFLSFFFFTKSKFTRKMLAFIIYVHFQCVYNIKGIMYPKIFTNYFKNC